MSEVTELFYIRADDFDPIATALREARLSGVAFGPENGWLTFAPYADLKAYRDGSSFESFTRQLSRLLKATVLHVFYAEDFGWSFGLAPADGGISRFACWWYPEASIECDQFNEEAFTGLVQIEALKPLIRLHDVNSLGSDNPALRFAELLRLPPHPWASPQTAQHHTGDLVRAGGRKIGTKPPSAAEVLRVPPARTLTLPRPDLSAREALVLVAPLALMVGAEWSLRSISGAGTDHSGRGPNLWLFSHGRVTGKAFVNARLSRHGTVAFETDIIPAFIAAPDPPTEPLPQEWLDSADIAEIAGREPVLDHIGDDYTLIMQLYAFHGAPATWEVTRVSRAQPQATEWRLYSHTMIFNAITGEIIYESYKHQHLGKLVEARQRLRLEGRDWETMPSPQH